MPEHGLQYVARQARDPLERRNYCVHAALFVKLLDPLQCGIRFFLFFLFRLLFLLFLFALLSSRLFRSCFFGNRLGFCRFLSLFWQFDSFLTRFGGFLLTVRNGNIYFQEKVAHLQKRLVCITYKETCWHGKCQSYNTEDTQQHPKYYLQYYQLPSPLNQVFL